VKRLALSAMLATAAFLLAAGPASATTGPAKWKLTVTPNATYFLPDTPEQTDENAVYTIEAENVGGEPTSNEEAIAIQDFLPKGVTPLFQETYEPVVKFMADNGPGGPLRLKDLSTLGTCSSPTECTMPTGLLGSLFPAGVQPGQRLIMEILVDVPAGVSGPITDVAKIRGGGAPRAATSATNEATSNPPYGFSDISGYPGFSAPLAAAESPEPYTQAGGHPFQFSTEFNFATAPNPRRAFGNGEHPGVWGKEGHFPVHDPQSIVAELPPGLIVNPQGVPRCSLADFVTSTCPISTIVGTIGVRAFGEYNGAFASNFPVYNLQPQGAYPGELGYTVADTLPFFITAGLRSGSDFGITAGSTGVLPVGIDRVRLTLWGVPAESSHDGLRGKQCAGAAGTRPWWRNEFMQSPELAFRQCLEDTTNILGPFPNGGPAGVTPAPFITMPTDCSGQPLSFGAHSASWQVPGEEAKAAATDPPVDGCNQLSFEPTIEAKPTTNLADAPSGLEFNLKVPQNEDPTGVATPELKEAVVKLPAGLTVNPSSANGLEGCSPAQVGLRTPVGATPAHFTEAPAHCPDAAKLGEAEVNTELLHEPLTGAVYLATPHENPFDALLAGYIVLEGQGLIIKLAGQFKTDPTTGQITGSFLENPQTPFKEFKLGFFGGARGDLRTPPTCGTYKTTSVLTPYSAPESGEPATPFDHFETTTGAGGGSCPASASAEPNAPRFHAGTESPQAGIYSPFSLKLVREDGSQELKGIDTTLPPGLVGKLAGIAECSDAALAAAADPHHSGAAEQASPSCPLNSEVGTVDVASGAGPTPLNVSGKAYLAGPYKGAPLSLAIVTPAVAGPFDLGTVVVRTALYVNPETAQIHAVSDPIPTILEGIPLDVRSVTLKMARPNFTLNPTNCEPLSFTGSALSVLNVSAPLTQRFQVGGCPALAFKPKLKLSLKGSTKRAGHPALKAILTMPPGNANIAKAQVTLPHSEFLDQGHLNNICTRVQFAEGSVPGERCPPASIYGHARAITPLLDQPLEGPVYLRSNPAHKLPDLVAALNGQIQVALDGKVDTGKNGGIRNSFEVVPDAPVSKFTLEMQGGRKGLLVNSTNICQKPNLAIADFTAQNGKLSDTEPKLKVKCPKVRKGHHHHRPSRGG
jgi:hypothetical protein